MERADAVSQEDLLAALPPSPPRSPQWAVERWLELSTALEFPWHMSYIVSVGIAEEQK